MNSINRMIIVSLIIFSLIMIALTIGCGRDKRKPKQVEEKKEVYNYEPPMYKYPSGEIGSLWYDWETRERGELIKN